MHIATMNHWVEIVDELMSFAEGSGLLDETEVLTKVLIGPGHEIQKPESGNIKTISAGSVLEQYEYPTLNMLWESCMATDEEFYIYYVHTKGSSNEPNLKSSLWRFVMMTAILTSWRDCVEVLDFGASTCGIMRSRNRLSRWYSGNFWWAKASHIRTLKKPVMARKPRGRMKHERWLDAPANAPKGDWPKSPHCMAPWYRRNKNRYNGLKELVSRYRDITSGNITGD